MFKIDKEKLDKEVRKRKDMKFVYSKLNLILVSLEELTREMRDFEVKTNGQKQLLKYNS
jgi:hypothetical protein